MNGPILAIVAICLQSFGQVLYTYLLGAIPEPLFVFGSVLLSVFVLNLMTGFRLPAGGRMLLVLNNIYTAITFTCFFFALRELDPSVVATIDTGAAVIVAGLLDSVKERRRPSSRRVWVCLGVAAGCSLIAARQFQGLALTHLGPLIWLAIAATAAVGIASALTAGVCVTLSERGWSSSAILAQRFYLTLVATLGWYLASPAATFPANGMTLGVGAIVALLGVLAPMLLIQNALSLSGSFTVLVCMSLQPFVSLALSAGYQLYAIDWRTVAGMGVVALFVLYDIGAARRTVALGSIESASQT